MAVPIKINASHQQYQLESSTLVVVSEEEPGGPMQVGLDSTYMIAANPVAAYL